MADTEFLIDRPKASGEKEGHCAIYFTHDEEPLKWSAPFPLPNIGDRITITLAKMQEIIGEADVVGFFKQEGFVGVMTKALTPPGWLVEQRERAKSHPRWESRPQWLKDGIGCEFGVEIALISTTTAEAPQHGPATETFKVQGEIA